MGSGLGAGAEPRFCCPAPHFTGSISRRKTPERPALRPPSSRPDLVIAPLAGRLRGTRRRHGRVAVAGGDRVRLGRGSRARGKVRQTAALCPRLVSEGPTVAKRLRASSSPERQGAKEGECGDNDREDPPRAPDAEPVAGSPGRPPGRPGHEGASRHGRVPEASWAHAVRRVFPLLRGAAERAGHAAEGPPRTPVVAEPSRNRGEGPNCVPS